MEISTTDNRTKVPLVPGMSVLAKYMAKPKKPPHSCKEYANKWHEGAIKAVYPKAVPPVCTILYTDGAVEEEVLYSSLTVENTSLQIAY